ncbi:hypothetical protein [Aminivibrio sp.]|uniref:hypothetical protein n=1 Tax=Aminivibrio sp. TaxID=1872489 RepID=UPI003D98F5D5
MRCAPFVPVGRHLRVGVHTTVSPVVCKTGEKLHFRVVPLGVVHDLSKRNLFPCVLVGYLRESD